MSAPHPRTAKRFAVCLLVLLTGLGLFYSCQSNRNLCPAYDQHYRREPLPY